GELSIEERKDKATRSNLRRRAEKLATPVREDLNGMSAEETAALVHEMDVHQVELDLQNEELKLGQKELEQSRNRYADLWDFAPVAYFTLSDHNLILEANLTAATLLGVERRRLLKNAFTRFVAPDSSNAFYVCVGKVSEENPAAQCELEMVRKDGTRLSAVLNVLLVPGTDNKERYRLNVIDITERKKADEQIRRQAKMLDLVGEAVLAGDIEANIAYWNDAAEKMYGWQRDEALGQNAIALLVPEASRKEAGEIVANLRRGKSWAGEFTVKRKDGTIFPSLFNVTPVFADGKPAGLIGASRDITQRKRMEESLRRSQASLAEAQRIANLGSWEWHVKTGRMRWSPNLYRILGLDSKTFVPTFGTILNVVHPDDRELFAQSANTALTQGKPYDIELKIVKPDGSVRNLHFVAEVNLDETGKPVKLVGTAQDITERKKAEEQVRVYERLATLGKVVGSISHELRNPLGVIDSSVFYLQRHLRKSGGAQEEADEKTLAHLERVHSSVMQATSIIQGLLNLTSVKQLQVETVDLRDVTSWIISESKIPLAVKVAQAFAEQPVKVNADRELLRMALGNIIKNAVQAMEGKGTLAVTIRSDGKEAELTFNDTGPGISQENLENVFQPLFSTKPHGIGLGLSITRMIVERHGGTITVQSAPGKGATFVIRLPLAGLSY
ncbi:MAG: PAS domain S-box protein, partial [Chloroflexi bacterium]|nr:PAS domain S-box protein [Chloroflexota bacterium]